MTNGDKHHRLPFPNNDDDTERVGRTACPVFAGAPSWVTVFSYQYVQYTCTHLSSDERNDDGISFFGIEIETTDWSRVLFLARNLV